MTIRSTADIKVLIGLMWGLMLAASLIFGISFENAYWIILFFWVMTIPYTVCFGRSFILDERGSTVCFWGYRKTYSWGQLTCKRVQTIRCFHRKGKPQSVKMVTLFSRPLKKKSGAATHRRHDLALSFFPGFLLFSNTHRNSDRTRLRRKTVGSG